MEMFTKEIGLTIKLTDMEYIHTQMGLNIKVTGKKISRTAMEFKHGRIRLAMKEIMSRARNKVLVNLHGLMVLTIRENSKTTIFTEKVGNSVVYIHLYE